MKIKKIILINYKRFENFTIIPKDKVNIIVGNNEVGKTSILRYYISKRDYAIQ